MHVDTLLTLYPEAFDKLSIADGWVLVWIVPDESNGRVRELYIERADDEWAEACGVDAGIKSRRATDETAIKHVERMAARGAHPHQIAWKLLKTFEQEGGEPAKVE